MLNFTKWKRYTSLTRKCHYIGLVGSNYESQLDYVGNYRGLGVYTITLTDGYKSTLTSSVVGLENAKIAAMERLIYKFNQNKEV